MNVMNELLANIYEPWFNYTTHQDLLYSVYDQLDYQKIGISLIVVTLLGLIIFYKFWDPVKSPLKKWLLTLLIIALIMFCITYVILLNNIEILQILGNYSGGSIEPNPQYFLIQMAGISFFYGLIFSTLLSFLIKYLSVANKYNPF